MKLTLSPRLAVDVAADGSSVLTCLGVVVRHVHAFEVNAGRARPGDKKMETTMAVTFVEHEPTGRRPDPEVVAELEGLGFDVDVVPLEKLLDPHEPS